ncbi:MAG: enoyl-CoA hydratase/isomerase family protein [Parvularculaceae bacterium]
MGSEVLRTDIDSRGVARLTMNRPEIKNAFNEELIVAIAEGVARASADRNVRAIVLTGAGTAFSAGADLNMMKRVSQFSAAENKGDAKRMAQMLHAIYAAPKPTIALVNGPAMGGGVGLTAACDIAVAADTAFFALSESRLGIIPAVISPFVIEAIGARQARRFFLTGERFDAETARRIGLVHMVAIPENLEATLDGLLADLLAAGPIAQSEAKDLIRSVANRPINDAIMEDTAGRISRLRASAEGKEGVAAFLEKRKPNWVKK